MFTMSDITDYTGIPLRHKRKSEAQIRLEELRSHPQDYIVVEDPITGDEFNIYPNGDVVNVTQVVRRGVAEALLDGLRMWEERNDSRHH